MKIKDFKQYNHILEIPWFEMYITAGLDESGVYVKYFRLNNKDSKLICAKMSDELLFKFELEMKNRKPDNA